MKRKGILMVVSGFSGAGKGTLMKKLLETYDNYALSVSMTTRQPREGERDGIEYFFSTKEAFEQQIEEGGLIEYAKYCDNYYGTPKAYVEEQLAAGKDVILEIEIQGALKIKNQFPQALLLFVTPPSIAELERRLTGRGTETAEVIKKRLLRAGEEAQGIDAYDFLVINDDLERCVEEIHGIVTASRNAPFRNTEFIMQIKEELEALPKGEKIMLHPSYSDLMKVVNSEVEPGEAPVVNSRYSIVMATSKRARQIISGEKPLVSATAGKKPLSIAVEELNEGEIKILSDEEEEI